MFVTVDFLIKLTCIFPDKSELISLKPSLSYRVIILIITTGPQKLSH